MSKIIFQVSELALASQKLLEDTFQTVWVEGEISNLVRPASGHLYFTLKDLKAQIKCAFFKQRTLSSHVELQNGLLIQALGRVSLYVDRGDFQLIIEQVVLAGDGALRKLYEERFKKLEKEGLFLEAHKKAIPKFPNTIGVITSPTGAAIRDILQVLSRRFSGENIFIYPTKVQGNEAANDIVKAIDLAHRHSKADVLILARGGGSLEDLWPFNEEPVARSIFNATIPILTGIGHEIDFTLADYVADLRAPTPSAAAELATLMTKQQIFIQCQSFEDRLITYIQKRLNYHAQQLDWCRKRIIHPRQKIAAQRQWIDQKLKQLFLQWQIRFKHKEHLFKQAMLSLDTLSPLATLNRGYSIVYQQSPQKMISSIKEIEPHAKLSIRLKDGHLKQSDQVWKTEELDND